MLYKQYMQFLKDDIQSFHIIIRNGGTLLIRGSKAAAFMRPIISDGFLRQFKHLTVPILRGLNLLTGFFHVFKPGISERVPPI